jgi:hypothetical protein
MKKLFILSTLAALFFAKLSNSKKQWHLDKKRIKKRKQLRLRKKPEVTIKPYDKVITRCNI